MSPATANRGLARQYALQITAVKLVAFSVVCLLVLVVLYNTMTNATPGGQTTYRADFTTVAGLRTGDDVRAAGVRVGRVEKIELVDDTRARVTFVVGDAQPLTDTTGMVVRYQNLLGQRYLALQPGRTKGAPLAAGSIVPSSRTSPGFDLTALLNGFEPLFATLKPDQVNQLSTSLVKVLQGEGGTVESLMAETAELTTNLAGKDKVIGEVLDHLTPVLTTLADHEDDFTASVTELRALMKGLADERTTIGGSIDGVSELSKATADLVEQTRPDVARTVKALRRTSAMFARNSDLLTAMFRSVPVATGAFARPMSYGTWLNMYICNLGIEVGSQLINVGPTDGPYSEVCR